VVATIPHAEPPFDITEALEAASVTPGSLLEVELQLSADVTDGTSRVTPVVYDMTVTHRCPEFVG
jgi:hypothetical protein